MCYPLSIVPTLHFLLHGSVALSTMTRYYRFVKSFNHCVLWWGKPLPASCFLNSFLPTNFLKNPVKWPPVALPLNNELAIMYPQISLNISAYFLALSLGYALCDLFFCFWSSKSCGSCPHYRSIMPSLKANAVSLHIRLVVRAKKPINYPYLPPARKTEVTFQ